MKCSIQGSSFEVDDPAVHILRHEGQDGLSLNPEGLATGQGSGYQALNLAALAGAATVLLVGYDNRPGDDGRNHFFGEHPDGSSQAYDVWGKHYRAVAPLLERAGVRVVNCTPNSAIDAFPRSTLEDELASVVRDPEGPAVPA